MIEHTVPSVEESLFTDDDLIMLEPDNGEIYELIEGKIVLMTPAGGKHGQIAVNFTLLLGDWNRKTRFGTLFAAETGFRTRGDKLTVRAPDLSIVALTKLPPGTTPDGYLDVVPDAVVEVVSPGDSAIGVEAKVQEWLTFGVQIVCVVYPNTETVHIHRGQNSTTYTAADTITGDDVLPGLEINVRELFA